MNPDTPEQHWERFSFGQPYIWVGIAKSDQAFLDHVMQIRPTKLAVEFGTFRGMTAYMLAWMVRFNCGRVVTIDHEDHRPDPVKVAWPDNAEFWLIDLLAKPASKRIVDLLHTGGAASMLIVDNGNKVEEVRMYAEALPLGALLLIHDWLGEVQPHEVEPLLAKSFEPYRHDWAEQLGANFRAWMRVR